MCGCPPSRPPSKTTAPPLPGRHLHGGEVMANDTIVYAPAGLEDIVAERLAGMSVAVNPTSTVACRRPPPVKTGKVIVVVSPRAARQDGVSTTSRRAWPGSSPAGWPGSTSTSSSGTCASALVCAPSTTSPGRQVRRARRHHDQALSQPVRAGSVRALRRAYPGRGRPGDPRACHSCDPIAGGRLRLRGGRTPAGLDDRTLSAIQCASDPLMVSSLDVTSIRSLARPSSDGRARRHQEAALRA